MYVEDDEGVRPMSREWAACSAGCSGGDIDRRSGGVGGIGRHEPGWSGTGGLCVGGTELEGWFGVQSLMISVANEEGYIQDALSFHR